MHLLKCLVEGREINRADYFIIQNTIQKKRLIEYYGVPEDRISIIPTGYDREIVNSLADIGSPVQENLIVFSGRISVYKGVFELVNAFEMVHTKYPAWKLWLVGGGPDEDQLKTIVNKKGLSDSVTFMGPQTPTDTIKHTNSGEIFVFPSYIESVPGSLLEAMALAKPVVVTDVGAIGCDIVDEKSGILVPPKDTEKLREGIVKLIKTPSLRKDMGINARDRVNDLTKQNMVKRTLKVYEKVVEK